MLVFVHQKLDDDDDNFSIKRFVYKYTYLFHTKVSKDNSFVDHKWKWNAMMLFGSTLHAMRQSLEGGIL